MPVLFPIGQLDATASRSITPLTGGLVAACALVFVVLQQQGSASGWTVAHALTPAAFVAGSSPLLAPLTSLFAHTSWLHLLYNGVALYVFGTAIERRVGRVRFAALFLGAGALSMIGQALATPSSTVPIVGASGAIAALAGAFAVAFPRARILVAAVFLTVPVRARILLAAWIGVEGVAGVGILLTGGLAEAGIAHVSHLTGFAVGALAMAWMAQNAPPDQTVAF